MLLDQQLFWATFWRQGARCRLLLIACLRLLFTVRSRPSFLFSFKFPSLHVVRWYLCWQACKKIRRFLNNRTFLIHYNFLPLKNSSSTFSTVPCGSATSWTISCASKFPSASTGSSGWFPAACTLPAPGSCKKSLWGPGDLFFMLINKKFQFYLKMYMYECVAPSAIYFLRI